MSLNFKEELEDILLDDWQMLAEKGRSLETENGDFETVETFLGEKKKWVTVVNVITQTPDGKLYQWEYERDDDNTGNDHCDAEYGDIVLVEVEPREKVVIEYVPVS